MLRAGRRAAATVHRAAARNGKQEIIGQFQCFSWPSRAPGTQANGSTLPLAETGMR